MNKVDVATASRYTRTDGRRDHGAIAQRPLAVRAPYCREPYVQAKLDGATLDAKAVSWDRTSVQLKWIDAQGSARTAWVPAGKVRRIHRDESSWRDPYDDYAFYYPGS